MKSIKTLLAALPFIFFTLSASAQLNVEITDAELLDKYDIVLEDKYPGFSDAKVVKKVYRLTEDHARITMDYQGRHVEELIFEDEDELIIIASYAELPMSEVPQIILDAAATDVDGQDDVMYFRVTPNFNEAPYYAVGYGQNGKLVRKHYSSLGVAMKSPR